MAEDPPAADDPPPEVSKQLRSVMDQLETQDGLSTDELLAHLAENDSVDKALVDESITEELAALEETLTERIEAVDAQLTDRIDEAVSDFTADVTDVRERTIQVKREVDTKAAEDHDHPSLTDKLTELEVELEELSTTVDELASTIETEVSAFEEQVSDINSQLDEHQRRLTILAKAILDSRSKLQELTNQANHDVTLSRITADAQQAGTTSATCDQCGKKINLSLLTDPNCPFCDTYFVDFVPKSGFFGNHKLTTSENPALEGDTTAMTDEMDLEGYATDLSGPDESEGQDDPGTEAEGSDDGFLWDD